jgi:DNA recombination protein RmuC
MTTETILFALIIIQAFCLIGVTVALLRRSEGGAPQLQQQMGQIRDHLVELQSRVRAREALEMRTADAIRRLELIIAGTHTKGVAGEQLLDTVFSSLPPEWQVRNLTVGNKVVEFGLRLPNGLVLPIDSKWAGTPLLERLARTEDPEQRHRIKARLEATVLARAREVRKYIDPNLTTGFAVAVVPDAVYDLCTGIQGEALASQVVLLGHSLFLPYLLLVFQMALKTAGQMDLQRLDRYLDTCQRSVAEMQEELEGRYARAMTMLANSRQQMAGSLSQMHSALVGLQQGADALAPVEEGEQPDDGEWGE